mgnify:FL=1|jgi:hypothetical protein
MSDERQRVNSVTREALTILYAAGQAIDMVAPKLEQLTRRVPNGWRDLRMVQSKLDKLVESVLNTIPVKQLDTMIAQMRISHLRIATNDIGKSDESKWLVPRDELTELVAAVVDEKCLMCDKTDWYNCQLRRIITDLPVDVKNVPNGCWRDEE